MNVNVLTWEVAAGLVAGLAGGRAEQGAEDSRGTTTVARDDGTLLALGAVAVLAAATAAVAGCGSLARRASKIGGPDVIGPDDVERLRRREQKLGLSPGDLRFATRTEVAALRAELDARYFPATRSCWDRHHQPCYTCQRLQGAQGDP